MSGWIMLHFWPWLLQMFWILTPPGASQKHGVFGGWFFFPKKNGSLGWGAEKNRLERDQKVSSGIHLHRGVVCQVSLCPKHPWTCALCHDTMVSLQTPLRFDRGGFGSGGAGNPGIGFTGVTLKLWFGIWRGFLEEMVLSWIQLLKLFEDLFSKKK